LADYLTVDGKIKCATCHEQHNSDADSPYLRRANYYDQMCKECHAPRDLGPGEGGSHPVGFDYPGATGEFPADGAVLPARLRDGRVECLTCHAPHNADSGGANGGDGDGMLLRTGDGALCAACHTQHPAHAPSGPWQPTCVDCHDPHDPPNANLSFVAQEVNGTPMTFVDNDLGANDLSDFIHSNHAPASYDGMCEVCHTATAFHSNTADGDHSHFSDMLCTDCHPHSEGFMPISGACTSCHGYPPDGTAFPNTAGAHETHMTAPEGPGITDCFVCHAALVDGDHLNNLASFASGVDTNGNGNIDLDETDVCDTCHSPDGPFDGATEAIANWASSASVSCEGCHDNGTSVVQGVSAPPVAGDNVTWGYYATGHGRNHVMTCDVCHDNAAPHFDGVARTYSAASDNYQAGFRLKDVGGLPPLEIPQVQPDTVNPYDDPPLWELCLSCHDRYALLGGPTAPPGPYYSAEFRTNFRSDASVIIPDGLGTDIAPHSMTGAVDFNSHYTHVLGPPQYYDSDHDGTVDSYGSCVACHNVHGGTSPVMVRDGKLIGIEPALNFSYVRYDRHDPFQGGCTDPIIMTSAGNVLLSESHGGVMRSDSGPVANGVCNYCHAGGSTTDDPEYVINCYWGDAVDYYRDPVPTPNPCAACHGQPPDGTSFPNTAGAHATHMLDPGGPAITDCFVCHAPLAEWKHLNDLASFASGTDTNANGNIDLDETDVCDACHSPDGPFDGVAEALANWSTSAPVSCEGCHDNGTSAIQGVSAPPVAGDNVATGFFATGHGRGGTVACTDCHDTTATHFDGEPRTYSWDSAHYNPTQSGVAYAAAYRLRYVGGEVPLMIPANYSITFSYDALVMRDTAFRLCFECHDSTKIFDDTPGDGLDTNFKASAPNPPRNYSYAWGSGADVNEHVAHLLNYIGPFADSDWDVTTTGAGGSDGRDTLTACTACHNVHGAAGLEGSTAEAMIRDGSLVGRTGYGFSYVVEDVGAGGYPMVTSTGATQANSVGAILRYNTSNMCAGSNCHDNPAAPAGPSYDATGSSWGTYLEYYRPWVDQGGAR
jgi:hypothetical protein